VIKDRPNWGQVQSFLQYQNLEMHSPYNSGFNTWPIKQQLYLLQEQLDRILAQAPTYSGEAEWLQDRKMTKCFDRLANEETQ